MVYIIILLLLTFSDGIYAQYSFEVLLRTEYCNDFLANMDNHFHLVSSKGSDLNVDSIQIKQYVHNVETMSYDSIDLIVTKEYNLFKCRTHGVGTCEISVNINGGIERFKAKVKPLPAVCYFGGVNGSSNDKMKAVPFRVQKGVYTQVECCGFDVRCNIIRYDIIKIPNFGKRVISTNTGGPLELRNQTIVEDAKKGDLYLFRRIMYQCPGNEEVQRGNDIIIEID